MSSSFQVTNAPCQYCIAAFCCCSLAKLFAKRMQVSNVNWPIYFLDNSHSLRYLASFFTTWPAATPILLNLEVRQLRWHILLPTRQLKLTSAAPWLNCVILLPGLHVFLERLYFFWSSRVYAGRAGSQREATAGGLRGEEEKPALKKGEN